MRVYERVSESEDVRNCVIRGIIAYKGYYSIYQKVCQSVYRMGKWAYF